MSARWMTVLAGIFALTAIAACNPLASSKGAPEPLTEMESRSEGGGGTFAGLGSADGASNLAAQAPGAPPPASRQAYNEDAPAEPAPAMAKKAAHEKDVRRPDQEEVRDEAKGKSTDKTSKKNPTAGMYIIRRANLTLQVPSVKDAIKNVNAVVEKVEGFVSDTNYEASEGSTPSATMTLRVPKSQFDRLLDALDGVGTIFARNIESEDVTMEYADTESRIKNKRNEEATLTQLLKRTGRLSEVLEMERELSRVRGEIEQAQGRLRHLSAQVDLATIEVTLSEKVQVVSTSPWAQFPAAIKNAMSDIERSLVGTLEWATTSGMWLLGYTLPMMIPVVLLYLLVGWGLGKWVRAKKVMPDVWFSRIWLGVGIAGLAMYWDRLIPWIVLTAVVVGIISAVGAVVSRLFVRRKEID